MHRSRLVPAGPSPSDSRLPSASLLPLTFSRHSRPARGIRKGVERGRLDLQGNGVGRGWALIGPGWAGRRPPRAWRTFLFPCPSHLPSKAPKTELFQVHTTRAFSSFPSWAGETGRGKAAFSPGLLKIPAGSEAPNTTTAVGAGRPATAWTPLPKDRIGLLAHRPCRP